MTRDSAGMEIMSRSECLRLLATAPIGRVALTMGALPAVLPVNFVLDDGTIVIRTGVGSKLAAATKQAVVAFEADHVNRDTQSGWSVMVVGRSTVERRPAEIARLEQLPLHTWVPGPRDEFVKISIEQVTGRRIPKSVRPESS